MEVEPMIEPAGGIDNVGSDYRTPQEFALVTVQLKTVGMHPVSNRTEIHVDV